MVYIGQVPTTVFLSSKPVAHAVAVNTVGFKRFHLDSMPGLPCPGSLVAGAQ